MDIDYSLQALLQFADYCAEKGLAIPATAQSWKSAAGRIFQDLSPDEQADVRKIDVETAFRRFANKNAGKFSPPSLAQYKARATSVLGEFLKFVENPSAYKPKSLGKPARKPEQRATPSQGKKGEIADSGGGANDAGAIKSPVASPTPTSGLSLSFPLRADFLAQVVVPLDLSWDEAKRLGAFIATLARDYKP